MSICDCLFFSRYKEYGDLGSFGFDDHLEISTVLFESLGDGHTILSSGSSSLLYNELLQCYSPLLDNDDCNLYIPMEGNPNDIVSYGLPKLLSNLGLREKMVVVEDENQRDEEKTDNSDEVHQRNKKCVQDLSGSWQLISEESDDMDQFLQKIGVGIIKRRVVNRGNFTLKVEIPREDLLTIKIEPFFGPSQTMNWDLTGEVFVENNTEVGTWKNKVEFIQFEHERTNNKSVTAISMTRESENLLGKVVETRWTQPGSEYSKIKFIRYR
ncbi:putative fatty acid binding protein [Cryptosporidium canis]|uniref:Fatty acid binding protein n=1 Tax=Cryptosporidium canis TaxID=195482 RepID=A0ABQ8P1T5_9CRYT|nr:putative fatty acid binding protein [Cryptosporidium canis]KAJ1608364.1 putative fatty acid binding protein [Cryptosporidium canis]